MKKHCLLLFALLFVSPTIWAQESVETTSMFLENKHLGPVNFNTKDFSKWGEKLSALLQDEFKREKQPFEVLVVSHFIPHQPIQVRVHTKPAISNNSVILESLQAKIARIKSPEALFTRTTVLTLAKINGGLATDELDYSPSLTFPISEQQAAFKKLSVREQHKAIQEYALTEIIPLLSEICARVDARFAGVRSLGTDLAFIDKTPISIQEVKDITNYSSTYWRALIEMEQSDQLVGTVKVALHAAAGDLDMANRYLSALRFFATPNSLPAYLLEEFNWRLEFFYNALEIQVEKAITLEQNNHFDAAIRQLNQLIEFFPQSAWVNYERYYTLNNQRIENGENSSDFSLWDSLAPTVFTADPFYPAEVAVRSGDEAYQLYLRKHIGDLFKTKKTLIPDMVTYADHALDLKAYAFAAHLYWNLVNTNQKQAASGRNLTHEFLYCLLRLGDKYTVQKFNPEVIQKAQEISKERHQIKLQNEYYQAFE